MKLISNITSYINETLDIKIESSKKTEEGREANAMPRDSTLGIPPPTLTGLKKGEYKEFCKNKVKEMPIRSVELLVRLISAPLGIVTAAFKGVQGGLQLLAGAPLQGLARVLDNDVYSTKAENLKKKAMLNFLGALTLMFSSVVHPVLKTLSLVDFTPPVMNVYFQEGKERTSIINYVAIQTTGKYSAWLLKVAQSVGTTGKSKTFWEKKIEWLTGERIARYSVLPTSVQKNPVVAKVFRICNGTLKTHLKQ